MEHDDRVHLFTPHAVRDADHRHLRNCRVGVDRLLDLDRVHVLAAGHDHVVQPIDEVDVALVVHVADVAAVVPPVPQRTLGLLGAVPVLAQEISAAETHLSFQTGCQAFAVAILNADLDTDQRLDRQTAESEPPRRWSSAVRNVATEEHSVMP